MRRHLRERGEPPLQGGLTLRDVGSGRMPRKQGLHAGEHGGKGAPDQPEPDRLAERSRTLPDHRGREASDPARGIHILESRWFAMSVLDDLHQARETYERREWLAAYRALSDLDDAHLQADDFTALAITAFLLGHRNDCIQALQRAYQAELEEHDTLGAVRAAYWLAITL